MTAPNWRIRYTTYGAGRLASSQAGGPPLALTHLAVGDRNGISAPLGELPSAASTALVREVHRRPINSLLPDPAQPGWIRAEIVFPGSVGGWTVREIGLIDSTGALAAIGYFPPTYKPILADGAANEWQLLISLSFTTLEAVTLIVDANVVTASRALVESTIAAHEASRNHPYAGETQPGFTRFATTAEAIAGTIADEAVTPAGLKAHSDARGTGITAQITSAVRAMQDTLEAEIYFTGQS
jgi:phage-related tail fiber protein